MRKLLPFLLLLASTSAWTQGGSVQCPNRPSGDTTNQCANTRFVQDAIGGGALALQNGRIFVGNASNIATGVALGGDCSIVAAGTITCTKTNGVAFAASATTDTTNASNISTGTLSSNRGGAGTVSGALKGNGAGVVSAAACSDLSNGGTACTGTIGTSGATVPLLSTANTWTLAQTFTAAPVFTNQSGTRTALGLGTAATQNTGTSGANLPFLNGTNTWAGVQTFTLAPVFTDASGSRTALGLGTIATQDANNVAITGGTLRATAAVNPASGSGLEVVFTGGVGFLQSYNRTGSAFLPLNVDALSLSLQASSGGALKMGSTGIGGVSGCLNSDGASPATITSGACGTGLPGGGTIGQEVYNISSGAGNWFTGGFFNIASHSGTDCTGVTATALSTVIGTNLNVLIPPGCIVKVSADYTLPTTKTLWVQCGATVAVDNTKTVTVNGSFVDVGPCASLFTLTGTGKVVGITQVRPEWWGAVRNGSTDDATAIGNAIISGQTASASVITKRTLLLSCGIYGIKSPITFTFTNDIGWDVKGCGATLSSTGSTVIKALASGWSGTAAMILTGNSAASITTDFNFRSFAVQNQTSGSGPATGLLIGSAVSGCGGGVNACSLQGYQQNKIEDVQVTGFPTNIYQQNARLIKYDRVSTWSSDSVGTQVADSVGWRFESDTDQFTGDTDLVNSQCVAPIHTAAFTASQSTTTLTVTAVASGTLGVTEYILTGTAAGAAIVALGSGSGGTGTYTANPSQTAGSGAQTSIRGSGKCVSLHSDHGAAGKTNVDVGGIRFSNFIFYGGLTQLEMVVSGASSQIQSVWDNPGNQHEGVGYNTMTSGQIAASTRLIIFHAAGLYGSGYGFRKNYEFTNNGTNGNFESIFIHQNFISGPKRETIDIRGDGGTCYGLTINNNQAIHPAPMGAANSMVYIQGCSQVNANDNLLSGSGTRSNVVQFNVSGDYLNCNGSNGGGLITGVPCSNYGAAHFTNVGVQ